MSRINDIKMVDEKKHNRFAALAGIALGCTLAVSSVMADDTDVFFGQVDASDDRNPNVLFVFDTSVSMGWAGGGGLSRLENLKNAAVDIIDQSENINIGLMRYNGLNGGGAVIYPVSNLDEPACDPGECGDSLVTQSILSVDDDVVEDIQSSVVVTNDLSIEMGEFTAGFSYTGLHFRDLNIPQGAIITSAELDVTSSAYDNTFAELYIATEESDSAAPFTNATADVTSRTLGLAQTYSADTWNVDEQKTIPNLESIIQDVVDRPGWCGGNDMNVVVYGVSGSRSIATYDQVAANAANGVSSDVSAPTLRVRYTLEDAPATAGCMLFTTSVQTAHTYDDAAEHEANGYIYPVNASLFSPFYTTWGDIAIGMRFPDLDIPQGATIGSAHIELTTSADKTGPVSLTLQAHATDDAPRFSNAWADRYDITNRPTTTTTIDWDNVPETAVNEIVQTPDVTAALQEVINRPGWSEGNATAFLMKNNGTTEIDWWTDIINYNNRNRRQYFSYEGSAAKAPRLVVQYQAQVVHEAVEIPLVRDKLKEIIDEMEIEGYTPLTDSYYEAALYMTGGPVTYGKTRGTGYGYRKHRVSHPLSYTGGTVNRDAACTDDDLNAAACATESIDGAATYISPITSSCQANHIVLLSDGDPSTHIAQGQIETLTDTGSCAWSWAGERCGRELASWLATEDAATGIPGDQTISTYSIGFSWGSTYLESIAYHGNGHYFEANTSNELLNVFKSILASVQAVDTTFVAPSTTVNVFNRLTNGNDVYFSLFKPSSRPLWAGNLKRYAIGLDGNDEIAILDSNGNSAIDSTTGFFRDTARSYWSNSQDGNVVADGGAAGEQTLGDSRRMFTYMGDYDDISAIGEDLTDSDNEFHEDNSDIDLMSLNIASMGGTAFEKAAFREDLLDWARGFDIKDEDQDGSTNDFRRFMGDPMHSQPIVLNYAKSCSEPCVDSTVFVATNEGFLHAIDKDNGSEIFSFIPRDLLPNLITNFDNLGSNKHPYGLDGAITFWTDDPNKNGIIDSGEQALLYVGMRRGGSNYYAFDVSDREDPKLAWVIEGGKSTDLGDFSQLGQTWSAPLPIQIQYDGNDYNALIFSAGYDLNQDPTNSGDMDQTADTTGRGFYIVEAESGELIYSVLGGIGASDQTPAGMNYSIPSNIRAIDTSGDGRANQMYFGDMGGQVWRFDVKPNHTSSDGDLFTGGVIADLSGNDSEDHRRFYHEPDTSIVSVGGARRLAISIGSGWRADPLNTTVEDRFYVMFSDDIVGAPASYTTLYESDLTDVTNDLEPEVSSYGWYLRMENSGEKVLSRSLTMNNNVYFTSYRPIAESNECEAAIGGGAIYTLSLRDGGPGIARSEDEPVKEDRFVELSQSGIPAGPAAIITENGPVVFVGAEKVETDVNNLTHRTFWFQPGQNAVHDLMNSASQSSSTPE